MSPGGSTGRYATARSSHTVENVDTEARLPAVADRFRQGLAADVQMRSRVPQRASFQRFIVEHRGKQGRHAVEDGRMIFVHQRNMQPASGARLRMVVAPTDMGKVIALPRP